MARCYASVVCSAAPCLPRSLPPPSSARHCSSPPLGAAAKVPPPLLQSAPRCDLLLLCPSAASSPAARLVFYLSAAGDWCSLSPATSRLPACALPTSTDPSRACAGASFAPRRRLGSSLHSTTAGGGYTSGFHGSTPSVHHSAAPASPPWSRPPPHLQPRTEL